MGEVKGPSFKGLDHDESCRPERSVEARFCRRRAPRTWARMLSAVALLFVGTTTALEARAQDDAPKVEPPASAPPALGEVSKSQTPPPPDVQKKDSAPAEEQKGAPTEPAAKQKEAPTAPAEKQKAAPSAPADAEKKAAPAPAAGDLEARLDAAQALSARYRFVERYGIEADPARPDLITQYRVGVQVTTKFLREKAQAAPERRETSHTSVFVERAGRVTRVGEPIDLMRRYDFVRVKDSAPSRPMNPPFLQGLTIWYHRRPPMRPQVLVLTPGRSLREDEYAKIIEELNTPQLMSFFPPTPKRLNETWPIAENAVRDVSGVVPEANGFEMTGTLLSVSKAKDAKALVAEIGLSGDFNLDERPCAFNARIEFTFVPRGVAVRPPGAEGAPKVEDVEAAGQITKAQLAQTMATTLPDAQGRARFLITRELVLERRPMSPLPGEKGPPAAPVELPAVAPTATNANSWVIYDHPEGRFHFRHPQELQLQEQGAAPDYYSIQFTDERQEGRAALNVLVPSKASDSTVQPVVRDPAGLLKSLQAIWAANKTEVTYGPAGWLPDDDWKDLKRRVYRIEVGLKIEGSDKLVYGDFYFVEFSRTQNFTVHFTTNRPDHLAYRNQTEDVIRSFQTGPFEKRTQQPSSQPPSTTPGAIPDGGGAPPANPGARPSAPATAPN